MDNLPVISEKEIAPPYRYANYANFYTAIQDLPVGTHETFGATPLDARRDVQAMLCKDILEERSDPVLQSFESTVPSLILKNYNPLFSERFNNRVTANAENYSRRLYSPEDVVNFLNEIDPSGMSGLLFLESLGRADRGEASMGELLAIQSLLGMASIELGCASHPMGSGLEHLKNLRDTTIECIKRSGGTYVDQPESRYRVKKIIGLEKDDIKGASGYVMTRKRVIGHMPDGTVIKERTSFILNLSRIPEPIRRAVQGIDPMSRESQDELAIAGGIDAFIEQCLADNDFETVLPMSTTVYASNCQTKQEIDMRMENEKILRWEQFKEERPMLATLIEEAKARGCESERQGPIFLDSKNVTL